MYVRSEILKDGGSYTVKTIAELSEALTTFEEEDRRRKRTSTRSTSGGTHSSKEHGVLGLFRKGGCRRLLRPPLPLTLALPPQVITTSHRISACRPPAWRSRRPRRQSC